MPSYTGGFNIADHAIVHFTQGIDFCNEDRKYQIGILVVECSEDQVAIGEIVYTGAEKRARTCRICQEVGHMAKDCPSKARLQACKECGKVGHTRAFCPQAVCSNCNEFGHHNQYCEKPVVCHAEEPEEPETPAPRPEGRLSEANSTKLTVKMHTVISPHHISSLGFGFEGSFPGNDPNSKDGYEHKSASIAFTKDNLISKLFCIQRIEPSDKVFTSRVPAAQVELAKHQVALEEQIGLYQFCAVMTTQPTADDTQDVPGTRPLYGDEISNRLAELESSLCDQQLNSPLKKWWKNRRINSQLGMEMPAHERPMDYKINRRRNFMSFDKYKQEITTIRIATFPGGGDQLYYAHLYIPSGSHYRKGAKVKFKLNRDCPDEED
ncbi:hypothetical protein P3342_002781 [Pyrenophora teres f. teres]|uniref:Cellular nucleic acid-binding protein n=1 Tax=Pyrenophora teres f. teres TaxID=97479 RepID=A0A6S6V8J0_9PLEO|nr:hypothetical protein HRS9122_01275 [Pyrenophora teres f. teres]KAE8869661.1 hypothetical protein PTNB29_00005 [Pyrenophora teres f. teres]KAK1920481.1 hypothetical protein P3342_002781 [Pyrenophora teres f. teres]CAE7007102.1 cellular nucleic acid-binding protein [Pyrenophora teres f. teres]